MYAEELSLSHGLPEQEAPEAERRFRLWDETMRKAGFRPTQRASFALVARSRNVRLPYEDHTSGWYKSASSGIVHVFTSQPYLNTVRDTGVLEMQKVCEKHGLAMLLRPDLSWWYPGQTTLVIVARPEVLQTLPLPTAP